MRSTERCSLHHGFLRLFAVWRCAMAVLLFLCVATASSPVRAQAQELIVDGGFELGGLNWQISSTFVIVNSGGWYLSAVGNPTPLAGLATDADGGGENLYVVTDQLATGTMALFQTFTVPSDNNFDQLLLSFDMFVNDWSGQTTYNPSQHARVDIIGPTGTGHLAASLFNAYLGTDGGPVPGEFRHYEFDIMPYVQPGQSYRVRFQTVVGVSQLNQGVDNVSVVAVPEPGTLAITLTGMVAIGAAMHRSRRRRRSLASCVDSANARRN